MAIESRRTLPSPRQYIVTPWRTHKDLIRVREALYHPASDEERQTGILETHAWKLRGNLPHAVESTGLLFQAISLHYGNTTTNIFALRSTYTMALSRFVTGYADLGRHRAGPGQTMQEVARSINLPPHFVEMRHEAAHEDLPSLSRLAKMADEALTWLWTAYWANLDVEAEQLVGLAGPRNVSIGQEDQPGGQREEISAVLRRFRAARKAALKAGHQARADDESAKAVELCASTFTTDPETLLDFCRCLMENIVPSNLDTSKDIIKQMQGAIILWDDFLRATATAASLFLSTFIEQSVIYLYQEDTSGEGTSHHIARGLWFWLVRMLGDGQWEEDVGDGMGEIHRTVLETCCLYPSDATVEVAEMLLEYLDPDDELVQQWRPLLHAARQSTEVADVDMLEGQERMQDVGDISLEDRPPSDSAQAAPALDIGGWRLAVG